jgi:hypothetical protein
VSTTTAAVSAATEATTTAAVEATAATAASHGVPSAAACISMSSTSIAGPAASIAATGASIANSTAVAYTTAISDSAVSAATVVSTATIVATATPVSAIPRAGADKEATDKPARAVVAVRSASIGIIGVVAPRTDWCRIPVAVIPVSGTTNPNTDTDLRVSRSRHQRYGNHQRTEQQKISEEFHFRPPRQGIIECVTNRFGETSSALGYLRAPTT